MLTCVMFKIFITEKWYKTSGIFWIYSAACNYFDSGTISVLLALL